MEKNILNLGICAQIRSFNLWIRNRDIKLSVNEIIDFSFENEVQHLSIWFVCLISLLFILNFWAKIQVLKSNLFPYNLKFSNKSL